MNGQTSMSEILESLRAIKTAARDRYEALRAEIAELESAFPDFGVTAPVRRAGRPYAARGINASANVAARRERVVAALRARGGEMFAHELVDAAQMQDCKRNTIYNDLKVLIASGSVACGDRGYRLTSVQ